MKDSCTKSNPTFATNVCNVCMWKKKARIIKMRNENMNKSMARSRIHSWKSSTIPNIKLFSVEIVNDDFRIRFSKRACSYIFEEAMPPINVEELCEQCLKEVRTFMVEYKPSQNINYQKTIADQMKTIRYFDRLRAAWWQKQGTNRKADPSKPTVRLDEQPSKLQLRNLNKVEDKDKTRYFSPFNGDGCFRRKIKKFSFRAQRDRPASGYNEDTVQKEIKTLRFAVAKLRYKCLELSPNSSKDQNAQFLQNNQRTDFIEYFYLRKNDTFKLLDEMMIKRDLSSQGEKHWTKFLNKYIENYKLEYEYNKLVEENLLKKKWQEQVQTWKYQSTKIMMRIQDTIDKQKKDRDAALLSRQKEKCRNKIKKFLMEKEMKRKKREEEKYEYNEKIARQKENDNEKLELYLMNREEISQTRIDRFWGIEVLTNILKCIKMLQEERNCFLESRNHAMMVAVGEVQLGNHQTINKLAHMLGLPKHILPIDRIVSNRTTQY